MPYAAVALAVSLLYGVADPAAATPSRTSLLASQQAASPVLVFDDEVYGDREGDQSKPSDDPDFNYGYEEDEDNSAHGPGDDEDDGWEIDEYGRSERA